MSELLDLPRHARRLLAAYCHDQAFLAWARNRLRRAALWTLATRLVQPREPT